MSVFDAVMPVAVRPELVFVRGEGSYLFDDSGRRYVDFVQGWAVNTLGHAPPQLAAALARQAQTLLHVGPGYYNGPMLALATALAGHSGLEQVFFTNSGAEANEGAIKLVRKWGALHRDGAFGMVTLHGGFHGRTLATMSASGKAGWEQLFEPKVPGFTQVPINDLEAMAAAIGADTVAVMLEPIQGEGGVNPVDPGYLRELRGLTRERGVLLVLDEVQTGMGRTGSLFAWQRSGVQPDIMTLGKGLGGGVPIGALLASKAVSCFAPGEQGGTFNGNPLVCAAAGAVFEVLTAPGFFETLALRGRYLRAGLQVLAARHGLGEVRGEGLLLALDLGANTAPQLVDAALQRGLLINAPRPHLLRFMPALNVSEVTIDEMLQILDGVLTATNGSDRDG